MHPLRFQPIFRRYLWGGHRLNTVLHKATGIETAAESWEVVDHQDDQSMVADGPLAGKTLRQLIADSEAELLGETAYKSITQSDLPEQLRGRFPLLFKFLDANQHLSVQVHPDDAYGATLSPPDLGKTEAWYVMHADPGSKIYAGLKAGVTRKKFANAIASGQTESMLHCFEPKIGDCVFIPSGTMHALGAGLVIAEIQQASNTTFRVFDWDRVDANGKSRELHIEQALAVTDFSRGPVMPIRASRQSNNVDSTANHSEALVDCDQFVLSQMKINVPGKFFGDSQFHLLAVTQGSVTVESDPSNRPLQTGETILLPSSLPALCLTPGPAGAEVLEIRLGLDR